jgi:carboxypeptidase Q
MKSSLLAGTALSVLVVSGLGSPQAAPPPLDPLLLDQIKREAFDRSQVMAHMAALTDQYGPRLTASSEYDEAAGWAVGRLRQLGVANAHLEAWPFGRSWSVRQSSLEMVEPRYAALAVAPLAWSASSNGLVTADAVLAPMEGARGLAPIPVMQAAFEAFKRQWAGRLKGKIVLLHDPRTPELSEEVTFQRYTEADLAVLGAAPEPAKKLAVDDINMLTWPDGPTERLRFFQSLPDAVADALYDRRDELVAARGAFLAQEGVVGVLVEDNRAHGGRLFAEASGSFRFREPLAPPTFVSTAEDYNRVARLVAGGHRVRLRLGLDVVVSDRDVDGTNVVGDIPGVARRDEYVVIGAHFDSWHAGTGATDNGAGCAVMMEVMRILSTLHVKLDRTVRIGLWGGEEQGYFGSRAYVREHLGDPATGQRLPEHARTSAYFNLDDGSGRIRGVYLGGNEAMRPVFEEWLAPFRDLGVNTVTIRENSGTDHGSFNAVGIPGFQFIQDPLDYGTVAHHSSNDTIEHVSEADLMQAAAVMTAVVVQAANYPGLMPRRNLPN